MGGRPRPAARARPRARRRVRQPAVAGGRRLLAGPRRGHRAGRPARAPARLRREGDARGGRPHHVDRAGRGLRGGRARRRRRRARRRSEVHAWWSTCCRESPAPGWSNALAAKLVALTMPGVPDVYQGSELWEQSLVDPDNRRPVDFDRARRAARRGCRAGVRAAAAPSDDGRRQAARGHARRCGCAATGPSCSPTYAAGAAPTVRPPTTRSPSTGAARSPWSPGCPAGWPRAAAGAPRPWRCRRAAGRPAVGLGPRSSATVDLGRRAGRLPVALLVRTVSRRRARTASTSGRPLPRARPARPR